MWAEERHANGTSVPPPLLDGSMPPPGPATPAARSPTGPRCPPPTDSSHLTPSPAARTPHSPSRTPATLPPPPAPATRPATPAHSPCGASRRPPPVPPARSATPPRRASKIVRHPEHNSSSARSPPCVMETPTPERGDNADQFVCMFQHSRPNAACRFISTHLAEENAKHTSTHRRARVTRPQTPPAEMQRGGSAARPGGNVHRSRERERPPPESERESRGHPFSPGRQPSTPPPS
ncbi:hypothetical protein Ddep01_00901 [Deinococcus depolymerans]